MTAAKSEVLLSKPIRIYDEDLTRLVVLAGEMQTRTGKVVKAQDALHIVLANYDYLTERQQFISELLEYPPTEGNTTRDAGFNAGWEAALYVALGCVDDMAQLLDDEELRGWLDNIGDSPLGDWLHSRIGENGEG